MMDAFAAESAAWRIKGFADELANEALILASAAWRIKGFDDELANEALILAKESKIGHTGERTRRAATIRKLVTAITKAADQFDAATKEPVNV